VYRGGLRSGAVMNGFMSYAHADQAMCQKFLVQLKSTMRRSGVDLWTDHVFVAGDQVKEPILRAIEKSDLYILLLSPAFFISDFILETEWPAIKKRLDGGNVRVAPVFLKPCIYEEELKAWGLDPHVVPLDAFGRPKAIMDWKPHHNGYHAANIEIDRAIKTFKSATAGAPA
jgi:hypothetical protein